MHGCRDPGEIVFLGGLDEALKKTISGALTGPWVTI
ncbi:hypothetical protein [Actibacterium sp.]